MCFCGDHAVAKLSRIGLLSAVALAMAAGEGRANPWLERTQVIEQPWDLPFVAQPRPQPSQQKQKRSRVPEAQAERPRELHRMPDPAAAPYEYAPAAANVFPHPRPPMVPPPPAAEPEPVVTSQKRAPQQPVAARDRNRQAQPAPERAPQPVAAKNNRNQQAVPIPTPSPARSQQSAAVREVDRNVERNLERQLKRELPRLQAPTTGVPPVPEQIACGERLAKIARYTPLPARSGPAGCGAPDLVKLESVLMADKSVVTISPSPQIRCSMAEQLAEWVRDDVGPTAMAELGAPLASITGNDAYECRPRNNIKGAKISEHGRGNAFDLATFRLKNGGVFNFTDPLVHKPFRDRVRTAACGRFMTVLGPGSDGYHSGHIHLDLAERSRNAKVCQWDVREVTVAARTDELRAKGQANNIAPLLAAAPKAALDPAPIPPADPAPAAAAPAKMPDTAPVATLPEKSAAVAPAETPSETLPEARAETPPETTLPETTLPETTLPETPAGKTPAENTPAAAPAKTRVATSETSSPETSSGTRPAAMPAEAIVAAPVAPAEAQAERSTAGAASPPLPMRKPEALRARQALAQAEQSKPRTERRGSYRYYNYRNLNIFRHLVR
jgi:hypothetical protein